MVQLLTNIILFGEIHVFLQHSWIGLFREKSTHLHLEIPQLQEVFLSKTNAILTGKMCMMLLLLTQIVFFRETHVFLQIRWKSIFGAKRDNLHLKYLSCRKHCIQKLTQYSKGINILDDPASNIDGFLWEIHVFLPLVWIGLFGTKGAFLHYEKYDLQEVFLSKTNSILTGKEGARFWSF
jgi:hypothetical protein